MVQILQIVNTWINRIFAGIFLVAAVVGTVFGASFFTPALVNELMRSPGDFLSHPLAVAFLVGPIIIGFLVAWRQRTAVQHKTFIKKRALAKAGVLGAVAIGTFIVTAPFVVLGMSSSNIVNNNATLVVWGMCSTLLLVAAVYAWSVVIVHIRQHGGLRLGALTPGVELVAGMGMVIAGTLATTAYAGALGLPGSGLPAVILLVVAVLVGLKGIIFIFRSVKRLGIR